MGKNWHGLLELNEVCNSFLSSPAWPSLKSSIRWRSSGCLHPSLLQTLCFISNIWIYSQIGLLHIWIPVLSMILSMSETMLRGHYTTYISLQLVLTRGGKRPCQSCCAVVPPGNETNVHIHSLPYMCACASPCLSERVKLIVKSISSELRLHIVEGVRLRNHTTPSPASPLLGPSRPHPPVDHIEMGLMLLSNITVCRASLLRPFISSFF